MFQISAVLLRLRTRASSDANWPRSVTFVPRRSETLCDRGEVGTAEHRLAVVEPILPQLVDLGAIGAVVEHADQHLQPVPPQCFQLLDVHEQAAVALDQHDLAVLPRGGDAERDGDGISDGAELPQHVEILRPAPAHMRLEIGLVAGARDRVPVLGDGAVELRDDAARIERTGRDREFRGVDRGGGDLAPRPWASGNRRSSRRAGAAPP